MNVLKTTRRKGRGGRVGGQMGPLRKRKGPAPTGQACPVPTFKATAFRLRPLLSLLLSESESLSILSPVAAAVTAVTAMTPRSSSSSLPPALSASAASLSEELTGWGVGDRDSRSPQSLSHGPHPQARSRVSGSGLLALQTGELRPRELQGLRQRARWTHECWALRDLRANPGPVT